jgi:signal transduction histidine kinase/CheY-like chemotaxis protein/ABC-type amino acid transport substrate-binding protein/HPt (histidine-containing phosphotransfer) domain-containing protein
MTHTTEAFLKENGEVGGYAALLCQWFSSLFGIRFQPEVYAWNDLLEKLNAGTLDFAGNLIISEERKQMYYMTDYIAKRQYKTMRIKGSPALDQIAQERPLRYAFLAGAVHGPNVASVMAWDTYEPIWVGDYAEVHEVLKSGVADAFIAEDAIEAFFSAYDDIYTEDFLPLIFSSIAMATAKAELEPIISVITKAMHGDAKPYMSHLFNQGYEAYKKHKFYTLLSEEEKTYLRNVAIVPLVYQYFNYPIAFYDSKSKKWDGIAINLLREVEKLTGFTFQVVNGERAEMPELIAMLSEGKGHIFADLIHTKERDSSFVWNRNKFMTDQYALLSKIDYPNVNINEIQYKRIALVASTAHKEMFHAWFPSAANTIEYANLDDAFIALGKGEVDLLMAAKTKLLYYLNYHEFPDYKANFLFNYSYGSAFAFNKNQTALCSIVDKAVSVINTDVIAEQWATKTYDYRAKMAEARLPWLIGVTVLSLITLALILFVFYRNRNEGKRLAKLVEEKTATIATESAKFKENAHWYESILHAIPFPLSITDVDQKWKFVNAATCNFLGKELQDLVGKHCSNWNANICNTADCGIACVKRGLKQTRFSDKGFSYQVDVEMLKGLKDEIVGFIEVVQDVTELERAIKQEAEAKTASRTKSAFLASMSHEIRTPMNAVLGITEILLQSEGLSADSKNALNIIYNSGYSLLSIINDLLDLSKIEAGKLELMNDRYEMASLINDTVNLNTNSIGSKPIEFKLQVDENLPLELMGDELRVKRVLNNLLSNAFKYTNSGEINLSFSAETIGEKVMLAITVSDTGQGMDEEQVHSMFDAYSRFNMKANRFVEGTGLGMNIVQHLVAAMDGDISVRSALGKGTEITVHLKQGYASPAKLGSETVKNLMSFRLPSISKMKKAQIVREQMPYGKVMVVDDMETNLYVAKGFLLPYGLSIDTATSGMEAIEKIKLGNVYDVIFMDHMMPVMDGIEAVKAIRANGYKHPIVAFTANAVAGQADMFMANGFDGFISKPIDIRELNASLNKVVRSKRPVKLVEAAEAVSQVDPELIKIFMYDAEKAIAVLKRYEARNSYESDNLKMYIINTHSLKSALANIGEMKLSAFAKELEQAGTDKNIAFISEKTSVFLSELQIFLNSPACASKTS